MNYTKRFAQATAITVGSLGGLFYFRRRFGLNEGQQVHLAHTSDLPVEKGETAPNVESMSLKTVLVFFRHGARTPLKHIPGLTEVVYDKKFLVATVPYTEVPLDIRDLNGGPRPFSEMQVHYARVRFKGGVEAGVLTTIGKDQMYMLGRRLAERYGQFVGKEFNSKDVSQLVQRQLVHGQLVHDNSFTTTRSPTTGTPTTRSRPNEVELDDRMKMFLLNLKLDCLRSTNIDRCIQSLQCVLAGLYGHLSFENKDPVVVSVDRLANEILIPNSHHCPSFRHLVRNSQKSLEENPDFLNLINRIQSHTGVKLDVSEVDMMQMRDHIVARRAHGLLVPGFLDELYPEIDAAAVNVLISTVCGNIKDNPTLGLSFAIGRLLTKIKDDLTTSAARKVGELKGPKLLLYSCHDSSVAPLLLAMGCFDNEWPPYAADVAIELYEDNAKQPWVKVKYCGKEMVLKDYKQSLLSLDQFLEVIQPYAITIDQYNLHCNDVVKAVHHINSIAKTLSEAKEDYVVPPNI